MSILIGAHFPVATNTNLNGYAPDAGNVPGNNFIVNPNHDGYGVTIAASAQAVRFGGANTYGVIDSGTTGRLALSADISPGTSGNQAWLMIKGSDTTSAPNDHGYGTTWSSYGLLLRPELGAAEIALLTPSGHTTEATFSISTFTGTTSHRYTLEYLVGGQLNAYEDGILVGSYNDTADTYGSNSVVAFGQAAYVSSNLYWDNLLVSADGQYDFGASAASMSISVTAQDSVAAINETITGGIIISAAVTTDDAVAGIYEVITNIVANILPTIINPKKHSELAIVYWQDMLQGDIAQAIEAYADYRNRIVQISGVLGAGGEVDLMGSLDGINYSLLHDDPTGAELKLTAPEIKKVSEVSPYVKPLIVTSDGTTKFTVTLFLRK